MIILIDGGSISFYAMHKTWDLFHNKSGLGVDLGRKNLIHGATSQDRTGIEHALKIIHDRVCDVNLDLSVNDLGQMTSDELTQSLAALQAETLNLKSCYIGRNMNGAGLVQVFTAIKAINLCLSDGRFGRWSGEELARAFAAIRAETLDLSCSAGLLIMDYNQPENSRSGAELTKIFAAIRAKNLDLTQIRLGALLSGEELTQVLAAINATTLSLAHNALGGMSVEELTQAFAAINATTLSLANNALGGMSGEKLAQAFAAIRAINIDLSHNQFNLMDDVQLKIAFTPFMTSATSREIIVDAETKQRLQRIFFFREITSEMSLCSTRDRLRDNMFYSWLPRRFDVFSKSWQEVIKDDDVAANIVVQNLVFVADDDPERMASSSIEALVEAKPALVTMQKWLLLILDNNQKIPVAVYEKLKENYDIMNYMVASSLAPLNTVNIDEAVKEFERLNKLLSGFIEYSVNSESEDTRRARDFLFHHLALKYASIRGDSAFEFNEVLKENVVHYEKMHAEDDSMDVFDSMLQLVKDVKQNTKNGPNPL